MTNCSNCGAVLPGEADRCPVCAARTGPDGGVGALYQPSAALIADRARARPDVAPGEPYGAPLGPARILGFAFRLWWGALGRLVLIGLIPYAVLIPLGGVVALLGGLAFEDEFYVLPAVGVAGAALLALLPLTLAAAAATLMAIDDQARKGRQRRTVGELFGRGLRYFWRLLGISALVWLTLAGLATAPVIGWIASWPLGLAASLASLTAGVYLWVRWSAALPAAVVEDAPGASGFGRSGELVRGAWWNVFAALLLYALILAGIQLVTWVLQLIPVVGLVVWGLAGLLTNPLSLAVNFAIYASLRDRELGAAPAVADQPPPSTPPSAGAHSISASPQSSGRL